MIALGDRVKDRISGLAGIVVAKTEWLYGCVRVAVQPEKIGKDGKPLEMQTFDEPQLDLVRAKNVKNVLSGGGAGRRDDIAIRRH